MLFILLIAECEESPQNTTFTAQTLLPDFRIQYPGYITIAMYPGHITNMHK